MKVRLLILSIIAVSMIGAAIVVDPIDAQKSCREKNWSHCKGDRGYYTVHGHHHCYEGEKDCKKYN